MNDYSRPGRKRLSVDIPIDLYLKLRMSSGVKNCTITKLVIRAILEMLKKDENFVIPLENRHKRAD